MASSGVPTPFRPAPRGWARLRLRPRARIRATTIACLGAGLVVLVGVLVPWWYLTTTSPGSTYTIDYYAGGSLRVSSSGGGGTTSYADAGVGSVGSLYGGVLAVGYALALLGLALGVYGFGRSFGWWGAVDRPRLLRWTLVGALGLTVALALVVPLLQPSLYHANDPAGVCTGANPPGPCYSFWGSSSASGATTDWGAGLGWFLALGGIVGFALALFVQFLPEAAPAPVPRSPIAPPPTMPPVPPPRIDVRAAAPNAPPPPPLPIAQLRRLAQLKALSDSGQVPIEQFVQAKRELLDSPPPPRPGGRPPTKDLPADELALLESLRRSGALTNDEFDRLRRRALLGV